MSNIRVRFAPSPTGPLHVGGLRTALYNYLFVRSKGGKMILRLEDTDRNRYVEGAEDYIINALEWAGVVWDEGPDKGGMLGPYKQSERRNLYKKYALNMVQNGWAYYAFDTSEELEAMRQKKEAEGIHSPKYDSSIRDEMNNSLMLTEEETKRRIEEGAPHVIRFKIPAEGEVVVNDEVRGTMTFDCKELDDKVLIKADGWPTYHLANVVDDYLMQITHVIRGEEWISSTGLHVLLYKALGLERDQPSFAHLPLILKPSGKGKLSKRDGAKFGLPVFPLEWKDPESKEVYPGFKEIGFDPRAMVNFIAFLGWNPGGEQEIYSMEGLVKEFTLDRVSKGGARFDFDKAKWVNQQYLLDTPDNELAIQAIPFLNKAGYHTGRDKRLERICSIMKERIQLISELPEAAAFFFSDVFPMDEKTLEKRWKPESEEILMGLIDLLDSVEAFEKKVLEERIKAWIPEKSLNFGKVLPLLRLSVTGTMKGPDIFETMAILGKEKCLERTKRLLDLKA
ncbi:MAG: glutamate--tRNA ligase [Saprospirales bacterium]|nr:MAG: glutamate--tRNA ligase [Saprospirales bacterium]